MSKVNDDWELSRPEFQAKITFDSLTDIQARTMEQIMTDAARSLMMDFVEEAWMQYGTGDEPINPALQLVLVEYFMHHDTDLGEEVTHKEVYQMFHLLDWIRWTDSEEFVKKQPTLIQERLADLREKAKDMTLLPSKDFNEADFEPAEHEGPHYDK
jgi:hypothetical protein